MLFGKNRLSVYEFLFAAIELILSIAPHKMIVDKLKQIADEGNQSALEVISSIFGDVKLAETASLGQIALERIRAVEALGDAVHKNTTKELEMQKMLEHAPWLIEPQWTVLQSNQSLSNFRKAFEEWYKNRTGNEISTTVGEPLHESKRPDFIMLSVGACIEIVEIKKPRHGLEKEDLERLYAYVGQWKHF